MLKIKRLRKSKGGGPVTPLYTRGPFLTESPGERGRPLVVVLHGTFLELRPHGCRRGVRLEYGAAYVIAARKLADEIRRQKAQAKAERQRQGRQRTPRPRRSSVRRGVFVV